MVKIPLPAGSYPTDEHEILSFRHWPGRKIYRYGLHFNGVDDYVQISPIPSELKTPLFDFTVIIYASNHAPNVSVRLWSVGNWYNGLRITSNLYLSLNLYTNGESRAWEGIAKIDTYKNYVITVRLHNEELCVFVNTDKYILANDVSYVELYPSGAFDEILLAKEHWGAFLKGDIYFFTFYNRPLDDVEISQMYDYVVNSEGYLISDGLVLLLDFTEHGSNILYDKSGNGNHGTIYGATWLDEPSGKVDAFVPVVEG